MYKYLETVYGMSRKNYSKKLCNRFIICGFRTIELLEVRVYFPKKCGTCQKALKFNYHLLEIIEMSKFKSLILQLSN